MRTITEFPHPVRIVENVFIPMRDGARLAARLWIPETADSQPQPAVLEYIPYRKRDNTRNRDDLNHGYIAGHGYVCARVDLRGSGDSDGLITDEYREQEHRDAEDVIAWLAHQDWCNGNVGMMGISWGGFNSLQMAARRPPALKAIVSVAATDDIYVDNMHYMGGCLLADNLSEATVMFAFNSLPPDPAIVGDRWREMWMERLENTEPWLDTWLRHQRRDDYWKTASVCENYSDVDIPVMAVGGWADGYTNAVFRLLENLDVPRKGLIGPWGHKYPHLGVPGPAIGFLQELVRWWDHWLKGLDTGVMDEPMLQVWMQDSVSPRASYDVRPGRWVAERRWPSPSIGTRDFHLARHMIIDADEPRPEEEDVVLQSPRSVGLFAGKWASYAATPDLPFDQREEDGGALVYETRPLPEGIEILGLPKLAFEVAADEPAAMLAVRLSDVAPNGEATRLTYGLLNLTHRDGSADPRPLQPGTRYRVEVPLNGVAQVIPRGHRLRVSISTSYWPLAWPSPKPVTVVFTAGSGSLTLPVRESGELDDGLRPFGEPEAAAPTEVVPLSDGEHSWRVVRDLATDVSTLEIVNDQGGFRIVDTGTDVTRSTREWYSFRWNEVESARGETRTVRRYTRDDWRIEVETRTVLTCTATDFIITAQLDAYELDHQSGDPRVYSGNWHRIIPRDLV